MQPSKIFISGVGTDVGKTVVSSIFVTALNADYFKPVQSGDLHYTDTDKVKEMSETNGVFHPESYRLNQPLSPHTSAQLDGIRIELDQISLPETTNALVVEGAGGLLVPLNETQHLTHLIIKLNLPVVLVSRNYLGSINHSLMSYEILKQQQIPMLGWVFNGPKNESGKEFILNHTSLPVLLEVEEENELSKTVIQPLRFILKNELERTGGRALMKKKVESINHQLNLILD